MLLFRVGYTFNHWLNPNLAFQHYYTSGDDNPNDNRYGQFERLFGGRRTDLNNTSIHGPLTPANLTATGFRVEFRPNANWDGRVHYSAATLSSNTDSFVRNDQWQNFLKPNYPSRPGITNIREKGANMHIATFLGPSCSGGNYTNSGGSYLVHEIVWP